jgi:oxygen-independent coproporphyrinogen-3 oxidase
MNISSLYIHIPFCKRKCEYCSFISYPDRESDISPYIDALKQELLVRLQTDTLTTIYFGGGTPSLLSREQIGGLIDTIRSLCRIDPSAEITIEANPGTVNPEYLKTIRKIGINRLSIGAQSFLDKELSLLGRIHNAAEIGYAVKSSRAAGFENISTDLIYGLPGQTVKEWQYSLEKLVPLDPNHISLYPLTLEAGLPMLRKIENGELPPIDPDTAADQYELAEEFLARQGYAHYEISNWAKPGFECRHNLVYWNALPYLGTGAGAHSYIDNHRTSNTNSIDDYLLLIKQHQSAAVMDEEIPPDLQVAEAIMLGLRLVDGISPDNINTRFGININVRYQPQIAELQEMGLIEFTKGMLKLTARGRLLGNEVFHRFLPDK